MLVQIVDDNDTNLMLFEQLALRVGPDVEVRTHIDPLEALEACRHTIPDLIVVDYMMPEMDGHQYVQAVRQLPGARDVPIVMVTAAAERSVRARRRWNWAPPTSCPSRWTRRKCGCASPTCWRCGAATCNCATATAGWPTRCARPPPPWSNASRN
jgi:CheY-like chemotaxis protein